MNLTKCHGFNHEYVAPLLLGEQFAVNCTNTNINRGNKHFRWKNNTNYVHRPKFGILNNMNKRPAISAKSANKAYDTWQIFVGIIITNPII